MGGIEDTNHTDTPIPIDYIRSQLCEAFERIWEFSTTLPLLAVDGSSVGEHDGPWMGAVAWIGGSWKGAVKIGFPQSLATLITSGMLDVENPTLDQVEDALREIANMTAGNLKSVLPGECALSTPGNFEVGQPTLIKDDFSQLMLRWYRSKGSFAFVALSTLDNE